jgi:glucose-1-phosphate thymidylyltransferase
MRAPDESAGMSEAQQAAAAAGLKAMMPVGDEGRPFLDYVLSGLADAGCGDVCLVVAPDHEQVRAHYAARPPSRVRVQYAVQDEPTGTARAVLAARAFAGRAPFLALNADNLYPVETLRALASLAGPGLPAFERASLVEESGFPAERVARFAVISVDAEGRLAGIREKPSLDDPALVDPHAAISMNLWRFDERIFDACRDVARSARGEYELPEAVGLAVSRGVRFAVIRARGGVLDLSQRGDVAGVSGRLVGVQARP